MAQSEPDICLVMLTERPHSQWISQTPPSQVHRYVIHRYVNACVYAERTTNILTRLPGGQQKTELVHTNGAIFCPFYNFVQPSVGQTCRTSYPLNQNKTKNRYNRNKS